MVSDGIVLSKNEVALISQSLKRLADNSDETNKRLNQQGSEVASLQSTVKLIAQEMHKSTKYTNEVIQSLVSKIEHQSEMTSALTLELKEVVMTVQHAESKAVSEIDNVKETVDQNEERFHQDIEKLEDAITKHKEECTKEFAILKSRTEILERQDTYRKGVDSQKNKQINFWQNNWFKFIGLIALLSPYLYFIYESVKKSKGG